MILFFRKTAEGVLAALLGVMFLAFIATIVGRYFFNIPTGWMSELTVVCWLWMVLWGSAFVLRESEEIRFDLVLSAAGPRLRQAMGVVICLTLLVLYAASLPAAAKYVAFMKVERTDYLHIRLDYLYSIYLVFLVAILIRYAWLLWRHLGGKQGEAADPTKVSSGL